MGGVTNINSSKKTKKTQKTKKVETLKSNFPKNNKNAKKLERRKMRKLKNKLMMQNKVEAPLMVNGNNRSTTESCSEEEQYVQVQQTNGKRKRKLQPESVQNMISDTDAAPANVKKLKNQSTPAKKKNKTLTSNGATSSFASCSSDTSAKKTLAEPTNVVHMNSITEGKKALQWLLDPIDVDKFFSNYWERKCLFVKHNQEKLYSHLISFEAIDQMLLKYHLEFTKNIDITTYINGVRETHNPQGRALPPNVWHFYDEGCSIRLLNPQTFIAPLCAFNAKLQEYFHCFVGVNAYLTPPNSQGFAPHYDDIEAFVIQIEGRKRWKLYGNRTQSDILARTSSANFKQTDIGAPIFDEVLLPGDLLYFPRGTIHQACTEPGYHSLHLTLSVYQKTSYADLFETMMPMLVQSAIESNVEMRQGLPLNIWQENGLVFNGNDTKERTEIKAEIIKRLRKFIVNSENLENILDNSVDQLAKKFQREALPPEILPAERERTIFGTQCQLNAQGESVADYEIKLTTNVRLLRANILRLVSEDNEIRLYYYLENSKEYCEYEPNFFEVDPLQATAVEMLIKSYPNYVSVSQFPIADDADFEDEDEIEESDENSVKEDNVNSVEGDCDSRKVEFATALWERGLLMMEKPFKSIKS